MNTPDAAAKLYEKKAGKEGESISLGDAAVFNKYFLNFRQGKFLVTLTGSDTEKETIDGLMVIAKIVERKIAQEVDDGTTGKE
jgi:hypothetical protein